MDFPIRREYQLNIKIKASGILKYIKPFKYITLQYKQATIKQVIEFMNSRDNIINYFISFIESNSKANKKDIFNILNNMPEVRKHIEATYMYGVFEKEATTTNTEQTSPFSSYIVSISEKLHIDPLYLVENYTPEQLKYLTDGIVYNINQTTKDGKYNNKIKENKNKINNMSSEQKKRIDSLLAKIPD